MRKLFGLFCFLIIVNSTATNCYSDQYWAKTYGGTATDRAFSIQQTVDEGYIVAGYTNSFGSGGYDIWVFKLNSDGSAIWEKTYGGLYSDYARSIQQTADEGYIVAGYTSFSENFDFLVLKLDPNGDITWQKSYGGSGSDTTRAMQQTADGGYIVVGNSNSFGSGTDDIWVLKLDESGNISWQKTYGASTTDIARSIQQTADGGYIVAGRTLSLAPDDFDLWVLKLDPNGDITWQKTYGGEGFDGATFIQQTPDEGYILAAWTLSFGTGTTDMWILKLDSNGNISWQKTYGGSEEDYPVSIQKTSDEGYIVVGWTSSFGAGNRDYCLLKLDSNGDVSWQKTYGGNLLDEAHFIQQTTDGGYIVAGDTAFSGTGSSDYLLMKLDGNGDIPNCNLAVTSNVLVTDTSIAPQEITSSVIPTSATFAAPSITHNGTVAEIRDACACEGDFDCDGDLDGTDAATFKDDFGRSEYSFPCSNEDPCNGDFNCDGDVDGTDMFFITSDFGRGPFKNPCPPCDQAIWCTY